MPMLVPVQEAHTINAIINGGLLFPGAIPVSAECQSWIRGCLEKEPDNRPDTLTMMKVRTRGQHNGAWHRALYPGAERC